MLLGLTLIKLITVKLSRTQLFVITSSIISAEVDAIVAFKNFLLILLCHFVIASK